MNLNKSVFFHQVVKESRREKDRESAREDEGDEE